MEDGQNDKQPVPEDVHPGFTMRDYEPGDRDELIALYDKLCTNNIGHATLRSYFGDVIARPSFEASIDSPSRHKTVVLSPEGKIIGWGNYEVDPKDPQRAELARLIAPEHQGKGLGIVLIGRLIGKCRQLDPAVTRMESQTLPDNVAAIGSLTKAMKIFKGFKVQDSNLSRVHFVFPINEPGR